MIRYTAWLSILILFKCNVINSLSHDSGGCNAGCETSFIQFIDATKESGLLSFHHSMGHTDKRWIIDAMGSGVAVADYDQDGDDDIYFVNGRPDVNISDNNIRNRLFQNDQGDFADVTQKTGVGDIGYGMCAIWGDVNNDGWLDLFVGNHGPNVLYVNNGDGTFSDRTQEAGVDDPSYAAAAAFGDVDADGDLDLYVGNYVDFNPVIQGDWHALMHGVKVFPHPLSFNAQPDLLYLNDGTGKFTDVSTSSGINPTTERAMGVALFDLENDGDLDIYVTNDSTYNFVLENQGNGKFRDVSFESGGAFTAEGMEHASMGLTAGDVNNDGFLDIHITSYTGQTDLLYLNDGQGRLLDNTGPIGLLESSFKQVTWGSLICDFDADGLQDIFTANGHIYPQVDQFPQKEQPYNQGVSFYRNLGKTYAAVTNSSLPPDFKKQCGRGAAALDYDSDGDMDIVINNMDSQPQLLENQSSRGNWLQITIDAPNAWTYGARVVARRGNQIWTRAVDGGSSYLSQNSSVLHFGFGETTEIDEIIVYWIGHEPQRFPAPPLNQKVTLHPALITQHEKAKAPPHSPPH